MVVNTLTLEIDDIYFLMGLSHRGSRVSHSRSRGGGEPIEYYVAHHYVPGTEEHSGKDVIRYVRYLPLRTILYTITQMERSVVGQLRGGGGESVVTMLKQLCFF
jgi:hypothetical protein